MKKNFTRIVSFSILLMLGVGLLSACGNQNPGAGNETGGNETGGNPIVTITMENDKEIVLELYPDKAPNTVANFISVVEQGYLDGTIFHRVSPTFMIQGGEMTTGTLGYSIKGEFEQNGFAGNDIKHERGVISMARTSDMDSATTQFFIMTADSEFLDGGYAAFGKVIEGLDVVDEIAASDWSTEYGDGTGRPAADQVMKKVSVDTKGVTYSKPETIPE